MKTVIGALLLSLAFAFPTQAEEKKPEVKMYATSWCPYCAKARAYFARRGIAYVEVDIEKSREGRAEYDRLGARGRRPGRRHGLRSFQYQRAWHPHGDRRIHSGAMLEVRAGSPS
jgi:hypothetical protein